MTASQVATVLADDDLRSGDLLSRFHRRRLEIAAGDRRGHRRRACCCAGTGGASTPGAKFRPWLSRLLVSLTLQLGFGYDSDKPLDFAWLMIITVADHHGRVARRDVPHAAEPQDVLVAFYRRTRPSRAGWAPIADLAPDVKPSRDGLSNLLCWAGGCMLIYGALFGMGKLILHESQRGLRVVGSGSGWSCHHLSGSFAARLECGR